MRTVLLLLFVFCCLESSAQTVSSIEYYYDTDPGFGKGTLVAVNSNAVDADFNFTAPHLPSGLHTLYIRVKNSDSHWSSVYQQDFLLTSGIAGPTVIVSAEYFYDTDPGFGKGTSISLNSTLLDSTLSFTAPNLQTGAHTLYVRLKSSSGDWSTVYQGNFLLTKGAAGSSVITAAEYFYDKDPGIGKGNQLALSKSLLDSTLNFPDSGLSRGVHTLFIRLMNNAGEWSTTYRSNVNISTGVAGIPLITGLEYFFDTDSGINKDVRIAFSGSSVMDTTISIAVPDNGSDYRHLGLRLSDGSSLVGNVALDSISLCDFLKPEGGFRYNQYGSTYTLIDTSVLNPTGKVRWLANNILFDSSYMVNYQLPTTSIPGSSVIAELTGTGCRVDTVTQTVIMPGVESYAPYLGSYNSDFDLNIYGGGLDTTVTVFLKNGSNIVYPYDKYSLDGNQHLIAVFDFHSYPKTAGATRLVDEYEVHVQYSNGYEYVSSPLMPVSMVKQEALPPAAATTSTCVQALLPIGDRCPVNLFIRTPTDYVAPDSVPEPYFATNLTGPSGIRAGEWSTFTLSITNTGTVVGKSIPFFILLPARFDIDTTQWNIINTIPGLSDSISVITFIDTVINGQRQQLKLIAMMYPVLTPGETGYFTLRIRTTVDSPFQILYTAQSRMFGSPMTNYFGPCWGALWDFAIGFIPGVSCFYGFISGLNDLYNFNIHLGDNKGSTDFSMALTVAGTAISCIPGGGPLKQISAAWANEAGLIKAGLGELEAINAADKGINVISNAHGAATSSDPCTKVKQPPGQTNGATALSFDPNYLTGNSDYDTVRHFINNYSRQKYTVGFENLPTASANAQHIYVTDTLNPQKFYIQTFNLSGFFIGDSIYVLPPFRSQFTEDVGLKGRSDMKVRFTAKFDTATGILRADFFSIDTFGHVLPVDSLDGFLPPDVDAVSGRAGLGYTVYIQNLNTLDTFSNQATVYFDANAPFATNKWINTVDTTAPVSKIIKTTLVNDSTLKLVISQSDLGSGIRYDELYSKGPSDSVFEKAGDFVGDSVLFIGIPGYTYQFYARAFDNVGNAAVHPPVADVTSTLTKNTAVTPPPVGNVRIMPNPIVQTMSIQNGTSDIMTVQVFDILGRRLLKTSAAPGTTTIDMSQYARGVYIVDLLDQVSGTSVKTKVVKL